MIATEQDALLGQGKAQMVRGVPRSVHRFETPALARDLVAVAYGHIRDEVPVATFFDAGLTAPPAGMRAKTIGPGASCLLYRFRRRRVIAMRVGDQDMGYLLAGQPLQ